MKSRFFLSIAANQRGLSLPAVLIVIAGIGFTAFSILEIQNTSQRLNMAQNSSMGADIARSKILAMIMNQASWQETRARNPRPSSHPSPGGSVGSTVRAIQVPSSVNPERVLVFHNSDGSVFYNPGRNGDGNNVIHAFGPDGEMFQVYPPTEQPLPPVYFKVMAEILETDPNPSCSNCADRIFGYVEVVQPNPNLPTAALPVYSGSFAFDFTRTRTDRSLEQSCSMFGGVYNQTTGRCSFRLGFQGTCPTGQVMTGYQTQNIQCSPATSLVASGCREPGSSAQGIENGSFVCRPLPNAQSDEADGLYTCTDCGN